MALFIGVEAKAATTTFVYTGAIETGVIETTGCYLITVSGATGGDSGAGDPGRIGDLVSGEVDLTAGTTFSVLVGGDGAPGVPASGG